MLLSLIAEQLHVLLQKKTRFCLNILLLYQLFEGLQIKGKNVLWEKFSTAVQVNMQAEMSSEKEQNFGIDGNNISRRNFLKYC